MTHDSVAIFLAQPTIGSQLFSLLLAAIPALIGGLFHYFHWRSESREKEKFRRFVEREAEDHRKRKQHGR